MFRVQGSGSSVQGSSFQGACCMVEGVLQALNVEALVIGR
jgi:hypothetical protein